MSYQCGIGAGMERLGISPCRPHIYCDGCGLKLSALGKIGLPHKWLLDDKAPRGWKMVRLGSGRREDYCPRCKDRG